MMARGLMMASLALVAPIGAAIFLGAKRAGSKLMKDRHISVQDLDSLSSEHKQQSATEGGGMQVSRHQHVLESAAVPFNPVADLAGDDFPEKLREEIYHEYDVKRNDMFSEVAQFYADVQNNSKYKEPTFKDMMDSFLRKSTKLLENCLNDYRQRLIGNVKVSIREGSSVDLRKIANQEFKPLLEQYNNEMNLLKSQIHQANAHYENVHSMQQSAQAQQEKVDQTLGQQTEFVDDSFANGFLKDFTNHKATISRKFDECKTKANQLAQKLPVKNQQILEKRANKYIEDLKTHIETQEQKFKENCIERNGKYGLRVELLLQFNKEMKQIEDVLDQGIKKVVDVVNQVVDNDLQ